MVGIYEPHTKKNLPYVRMVNTYAAGITQKVTIVGTPHNDDACENMQISFVYYRMRSYIKELMQMEARFRERKLLISRLADEQEAESFPFKPGKDFKMEIFLDKQNPTVIKVDAVEIKHPHMKHHIDDYLHVITVNGDVKLHEFSVDPEPAKQIMEQNSRVVITPANARPFLSHWDDQLKMYQTGYYHYLSGFDRGKRIVLDMAMAKNLPVYSVELISLENRIGPGFKLYKPFILNIEFEKRKVYFCSRSEPEETDNSQFEYLSERFEVQEIRKPFPFNYEQRMQFELKSGDRSSVEVRLNGNELGRHDIPMFDLSLVNMLIIGSNLKVFSISIEPEIDQQNLAGGVGAKPGGGVQLETDDKIWRYWKVPYYFAPIGGFLPPKMFRIYGTMPKHGYFFVRLYEDTGKNDDQWMLSFAVNVLADRKFVDRHWLGKTPYRDRIAEGANVPFDIGVPFTLDLIAGTKEIIFDVNGKRFNTVPALEEDLRRIQQLRILHTINLHGVFSDKCPSLKLPYECDLFGFLTPTHFRVFGIVPKAGTFYVRMYDEKATDNEKYLLSFGVNLLADKKFVDRHWLGKPEYKERIAEGNGVPFEIGHPFMLDLIAGNEQIVFNVNNQKFNTVACTTEDLKKIAKLKIYENINLHAVELSEPFTGDIKDGFTKSGKKIRIFFIPLNQGDTRSRLDLFDAQNEILFHFSIRPDQKKVHRNTFKKVSGWQTAEEDGPFPFVLEKQCILEFVAQKEKIECLVDGKKEFEFKARDDLSAVNKFEISGNMILQSVQVLEK